MTSLLEKSRLGIYLFFTDLFLDASLLPPISNLLEVPVVLRFLSSLSLAITINLGSMAFFF